MSRKRTLSQIHLPALQCFMGDRGYFVTSMTMRQVAERIEYDVRKFHNSEKLSNWIQRELDEEHADEISNYLTGDESRFFNSLVIGVYGGDPQWAPLAVSDPRDELNKEEEERINGTVGILVLTGAETLFPIDGQHRVAGIRKAVADQPALADENVSIVLVGHAATPDGEARTRRLFVTLNQRAKKVSTRDIVALDEDNGLAVITRQLVDEFDLFRRGDFVAFSDTVNIPESDQTSIISILGIFQIAKALYPSKSSGWPKKKDVERSRPDNLILDKVYGYNCRYWKGLVERVREYRQVLTAKKRVLAGQFRSSTQNHLLFRPAGQAAFARAVECLVSRGEKLEKAMDLLCEGVEFSLFDPEWHNILYEPISGNMMKNSVAAETLILRMAGKPGRTADAERKLDEIIAKRDEE